MLCCGLFPQTTQKVNMLDFLVLYLQRVEDGKDVLKYESSICDT